MREGRLLTALVPLGAALLRPVVLLLAATWRIRVVEGEERLERLTAVRRPAIYAFWHDRLYPCGYHLYRYLRRRGPKLALLASLSRDGELVARIAAAEGMEPVRGSTSRAGLSGLRQLHRAIVRRGLSVVTAPDGPRGPAHRCQPGTVVLAATSGAPLVPLAAAADRVWRVRSWDRLQIPKPFARVVIAVGEAMEVDRKHDPGEGAAELGRRLDRMIAVCEGSLASPARGEARRR